MARFNKMKVKKLYLGSDQVKGQNKKTTLVTATASDLNKTAGGVYTGNIVGNVTGNVIGNVTGDLTGTADIATLAITATALGDSGSNPVNAVAAQAKLTNAGAVAPATHAVSVLTSDATNVTENTTITINTVVYTWKADPTGIANAVDIGASAAVSLDNLKAAINASGTPDTEYGAGTVANPFVVATTNSDTQQTIQAKVPGTVPNAYPTEETDDHLSWADSTLGGGTGASTPGVDTATATITIGTRTYTVVDELSETAADAIVDQILYGGDEATLLDNLVVALNAGATEGTNYSTGTVVNADVTATTNTNTTQVIVAKVAGVIGNSIPIECTWANTDWDDEVTNVMGTEVAGVDGTVGIAGEIRFDTSLLYIAVAANTIADANWYSATLTIVS
jgi:hypothetical protein